MATRVAVEGPVRSRFGMRAGRRRQEFAAAGVAAAGLRGWAAPLPANGTTLAC